ncbi:hypothetical protein ACFL0U_04510 [Pseudomonadota bacterium]
MNILQNKISIILLGVIALVGIYFVANDISEKATIRAEKEIREQERKAQWEKEKIEIEARHRKIKEAAKNSKFNRMLGEE